MVVKGFGAMLVLAFSASQAQEEADSEVPDYSNLRYAKPDSLPLTASAALECRIDAQVVRKSAKRAVTRTGMEAMDWPTLQGDDGWFGLYVALECDEGETAHLHVSFVDSINGQLELYGGLHDNRAGRTSGLNPGHQRSSAAGLSGPPPDGISYAIPYPSFVERVVDIVVSRFLRARFEL